MTENINHLQGTISEVSNSYEAELIVTGEPSLDEQNDYFLNLALNELVINCLENRVPGSEIGAQKVEIVFQNDHILVRDDFKYDDKTILRDRLQLLTDRVRTCEIATTKTVPGGLGVTSAVKTLGEIGRELEYHQEGRGIVAKISKSSNN
jgi:two-component sensor histidine kinase